MRTAKMLLATWTLLWPSLTAAQMSDAEQKLASLVDCQQFKKNADGSWTGAPDARIGKIMAGGQVFVRGGFKLDGADIATVLNNRCGLPKR